MKPLELEEHFSKYGDIKSLKISLNSDHSSRGYGFVCFQDPASASDALADGADADSIQVIKYQPRDKRDFRRIYNNIYVKNFPQEFTEEDIRKLFSEYGRIESLFMKEQTVQDPTTGETKSLGYYAFICYDSEDKSDRQYGPACAERAVLELHNTDEINGIKLEKRLYVKEALPKREREAERLRDTIKYKNSKKRCNLYVKGFSEDATEEDLRRLFDEFGEIESIRLHPHDKVNTKKHSAFVCFKKPDEASSAKEKLHGTQSNNRTLIINHYEIKEIRQLQNEATQDKRDFQQFRSANTQGAKWTDLANQEDLQYYLKLLIENLPSVVQKQQGRQGMGPQGQKYQNYGQKQGYQGGKPQNKYNQNRMMGGGMPNQQQYGNQM